MPRTRSLAFVAAVEAWVPRPSYVLNDLMGTIGSAYVSFEPCRYDCTDALRVAERVAAAVEAHDPQLRERIDTALRRDVLVLGSGQRAVVELRDDVIESLEPLPAPERVITRAEALEKLRGARVDEHGRVAARDDALVIRFAGRA